MWISRKHYEHLFGALSAARERILQLERMEAGHAATVEWLRTHVNRLEVERGILTSERLRVNFPVPSLEREDGATPATAKRRDDLPQGEVVAGLPVDPVAHGLPADSIPLAQLLGSILEDMGDDAAGRMGISHDETGHVVHAR